MHKRDRSYQGIFNVRDGLVHVEYIRLWAGNDFVEFSYSGHNEMQLLAKFRTSWLTQCIAPGQRPVQRDKLVVADGMLDIISRETFINHLCTVEKQRQLTEVLLMAGKVNQLIKSKR